MSVCLFHCFSLPDSPFLCYLMVTSYCLILGTKSHYHVKKIHRQCDPFFPLNSPSRGFNSISGNTVFHQGLKCLPERLLVSSLSHGPSGPGCRATPLPLNHDSKLHLVPLFFIMMKTPEVVAVGQMVYKGNHRHTCVLCLELLITLLQTQRITVLISQKFTLINDM